MLPVGNGITRPVTIVALCCVALVYAASFSSGIYNEYVYDYEVHVASGPAGFRFKAKASLEVLYAIKATATGSRDNEILNHSNEATSPGDSLLVRLRLTDPVFFPGPSDERGQEPFIVKSKYNKIYNPNAHLYAHIVTLANGTAIVKEIFTHQEDETTFKNIKKSLLLNLLPTSHHLITPQHHDSQHNRPQEELLEYISLKPLCVHEHNNNLEQPELFSPDSTSQANIIAKAHKSNSPDSTTASTSSGLINLPVVFQSVEGQQNVTFRSRVFNQAESNLTTKFSLELTNQVKSNAHEKFDQADSMAAAIKLLDDRQQYQLDTIQLERERRICSTHHCDQSLDQLFKGHQESLNEDAMAEVEAPIALLRLLERLRLADGTSVKEILAILKTTRRQQSVQSSLLEILAKARTKDSIQAALKFLRLPKNKNLDVAERFLSALSISAKTAAKMHLGRPLQSPYYFTPIEPLKLSREAKSQLAAKASLEFIVREFLDMYQKTPADKWALEKMRWSSLLTLATLVNAYNQEHHFANINDELNQQIEKLLLDELATCHRDDADCRIVAMQAIGNAGRLGVAQFEALKNQVLAFGGRGSNSAMKVLRDLLQNQAKNKQLTFYESLEDFLMKIVYDNAHETTSRVLAAEMIVRFVPNSLVSEELLKQLPTFGNNELATMIYSRIQSLKPVPTAKHLENWYWRSCIINGTSASFVKTMARTESLNASYGVNVELSDKGKMFKESSFDVLLDTKDRTQDLFSLGIFARGLSKMSGSEETSEGPAEDEATMAGMNLKLLGGYLRPYIFFSGYSELMGHLWSGTASEPTTAYNGNLLLIDHDEGYPLITGFVAEQRMRGLLSIDVSGQVKVSILWSKRGHSTVTTKASVIVQASQSIFTSYDHLWMSHLFSFGGQALIDFKADANFGSLPVQTCLQVTQPQFSVRYNSRRHEQMMTSEVRRKLTRRNYLIGAKSYSLNSENNKMCSLMIDEL